MTRIVVPRTLGTFRARLVERQDGLLDRQRQEANQQDQESAGDPLRPISQLDLVLAGSRLDVPDEQPCDLVVVEEELVALRVEDVATFQNLERPRPSVRLDPGQGAERKPGRGDCWHQHPRKAADADGDVGGPEEAGARQGSRCLRDEYPGPGDLHRQPLKPNMSQQVEGRLARRRPARVFEQEQDLLLPPLALILVSQLARASLALRPRILTRLPFAS
jgi:hypothetical protein